MIAVYALILVPILLFVLAFLYETFLSFKRLKNPKKGKTGYVHATWEVTHTLLVFGVVMLVMLFTKSLDRLADVLFLSTFIAALALVIRSITYTYVFYGRKPNARINWIDWVFALSHVVAALALVVTVVRALWYLFTENPMANEQFIPYFIPGLVVVLALCAMPIMFLYRVKD